MTDQHMVQFVQHGVRRAIFDALQPLMDFLGLKADVKTERAPDGRLRFVVTLTGQPNFPPEETGA